MISRGIASNLNHRISNLSSKVKSLTDRVNTEVATDLSTNDVQSMIDSIVPGIQSLIQQNASAMTQDVENLGTMVMAEVSKLNSIIGDPCFYELCDAGNLVGTYLTGSYVSGSPLGAAQFIGNQGDVIFYGAKLQNNIHLLMVKVTIQVNGNTQYQSHTVTGRRMYDTSQEGSQYNYSNPGSNINTLYNLGTPLNSNQLDIHPTLGFIFNGTAHNDIPSILNPTSLQSTIEDIVETALGGLDLSSVNGFGDSVASQVAAAIVAEIGNSNIDVSQIVADAIATSLSTAQLSAQDEADLGILIGQGIATALIGAQLSPADEAVLEQLIVQGITNALPTELSAQDEAALGQLITDAIASQLITATLSQQDQNALQEMISNTLASLMGEFNLSAEDEATIQQLLEASISAQITGLINNLDLTSEPDFLNAILTALILPFNSSGQMNNHIIPTTNASFDLGNAEKKIRHLFLSDNSMWVGDSHKISVESGTMKMKKHNRKSIPQAVYNLASGLGEVLDVQFVNNIIRSGISFSDLTEMTVQDWVDVVNGIKDQYVSTVQEQNDWPYKNDNGTVRDANFNDIFGHYSYSANSEELLIEQNARKDPVRVIDTNLTIDYSLDPFDVAVVSGSPEITVPVSEITVDYVPSGTKLHFQKQDSSPCDIYINASSIQITTSCSVTLYQNSDGTEFLLHQSVTSNVYGGALPAQDLTPPEVSSTSFNSASQVSFSFNEPMDTTKGSISQS